MSDIIPTLVPTVHQLRETFLTAHAKHQAIHRAHHHLAAQIATERRNMIASGQQPPISTTPPSGMAGVEGPPPSPEP